MELKDVVIKAQNGDNKAFAALFEQTQKMVYFTSLKITGDENAAEDLAQEVYLKAMEKLGTLKVPEAFIGWLRQITVNVCKNYLAAKKPAALGESENDEMLANLPEVEENFIPHAYADNKETCRLIMAMVDSLPENQRAAVIMYYYNELPVSRIAELLQVSENTVKSRLNYARRQIKEQVEDLEKKGTKLHAVPVLGLVLQRAAEDCTLSSKAAAVIAGAIAAQGAATAAATTAATAATATTAATGGILAKIAALPIATKIIAGVLSVGVAVGAGVGIASVVKDDKESGKGAGTGSDETVEVGGTTVQVDITEVDDAFVSKYKNYDMTELFGMTKDEIKAEFGDLCFEDENCVYYNFSKDAQKASYDMYDPSCLSFMFDEEAEESEYPVEFVISGSLFEYKGVKTGISREEAKALLENEAFTLKDELGDCDTYELADSDLYLFVYHYDGIVTETYVCRAYELKSDDGEVIATTAGEELASLDGIEEMLGLTKTQVFAKWGETYYDEEDARAQYVFEDEAIVICFVDGVADEIVISSFNSVFGLDQNMTADEMLAHLGTVEEVVHMDEYSAALKHFNVYTENARYYIRVDNNDMFECCRIYRGGYEAPYIASAFIRDISVGNGVKDKSHIPVIKAYSDGSCTFKLNDYNGMQILEGTYESFEANGTTTYTFNMKATDYMEGGRFNLVHESGSDTAAFYTIGNSYFGTTYDGDLFKAYLDNAEETVEEFEESIAANQAVQSTLISYWENNLKGEGGWYAFADVTHDGKDELFNLVKKHDSDYDADYSYFGVYALIDGEVVQIDNGYFTQNPGVLEYYHLYYENEKAYIIYRYYTGRQGGVSSFYNIYSFNGDGNKVMLRSEDFSGLEADFTAADYARIDEIEENYQEYREKSQIIIDVVYGVLNVGGWW